MELLTIQATLSVELFVKDGVLQALPERYESLPFTLKLSRAYLLTRSYHCPVEGVVWARTKLNPVNPAHDTLIEPQEYTPYNRSYRYNYIGEKGSLLIDKEDPYILPFPLWLREFNLRGVPVLATSSFDDALF